MIERQHMYGLTGKMIAQPGQRDALIDYLLQAAQGMQTVEGCYIYIVSSTDDDPNGIWITEVWHDKEAHDASLTLDSSKELIAKARPLIAGFGERFEVTPLGGKGLPDNA
jgi:quinol monooxygenase YgiN